MPADSRRLQSDGEVFVRESQTRGHGMDMQEYLKNRHQFPHDELEKHAGKYVAWSPDGTRIIASEGDVSKLCAAVDASGYDPADVVMEPIPLPDEIILGGGLDE